MEFVTLANGGILLTRTQRRDENANLYAQVAVDSLQIGIAQSLQFTTSLMAFEFCRISLIPQWTLFAVRGQFGGFLSKGFRDPIGIDNCEASGCRGSQRPVICGQ